MLLHEPTSSHGGFYSIRLEALLAGPLCREGLNELAQDVTHPAWAGGSAPDMFLDLLSVWRCLQLQYSTF